MMLNPTNPPMSFLYLLIYMSKRPCKYGERDIHGKCPKKPKTMTQKTLRPCKYGERDIHGKCPKKPKTMTQKKTLRPCKYGERDIHGKCPKKPTTISSHLKENWDKVSHTKKVTLDGKVYTVIVIPKNTYVYRGFSYGDDPARNRNEPDPEWDYDKENAAEYKKRKNTGVYYATLPIAAYYAFHSDYANSWKHVVVEYKTKQSLQILDMSVWENLKNIVDDSPELADDLEITHGFSKSKEPLYRFSGGNDDEMTKKMTKWIQHHPSFDGFGHIVMNGLHSEFTCLDRNKLHEETEYVSEHREKIMHSSKGAIDIHTLQFSYTDQSHIHTFNIAKGFL